MDISEFRIPEDKLLVFEFRGGPRDGQESRSDVPTSGGGMNEAQAYWFQTEMGVIGKYLGGMSPRTQDILLHGEGSLKDRYQAAGGPVQLYVYQLIERLDSDSEIVCICEYRGVPKAKKEDNDG